MRLLTSGDWHLGAGASLGRASGDRLEDQRAVTHAIAALASEREVEAVLLAGDLLDGPHVTPEQLEVLADFVEACDIPIVAISGNGKHDAAMRSVNGLAIFDRLPGITVYSRPALHDLGPVQVACLPWVSPARLVASMDGDVDRDRVNARAAQLLVRAASEICDPQIKPTVLMLHGSLSGASLPAGISTDELREPVIPIEELADLGYAAIVASHIHVPQIATADDPSWTRAGDIDAPWLELDCPTAIYTGSPLPLNFGETSVPHGVWILDVDEKGTRVEFVAIESRRLQHASFDIAGLEVDEFVESIYDPVAWPEVADAIVKVTLRCTQAQQRRLDRSRLRKAVLDAGAHTVKIDVDTVREQRSRVDGVTGDLDPLDAFDLWVAANDIDPDLAAAAREQMQADLEQVGS